jgi:arylformamidase
MLRRPLSSKVELIDITGRISPAMWSYSPPYFGPIVTPIASPEWVPYPVYSEAISMPLQTGTYIETAAHVDPNRERVGDLPIQQTVLVSAICVQTPAAAKEGVTRERLERAVAQVSAPPYEGLALIVSMGWSRFWESSVFTTDCPYFTSEAMDFVIESGFGIVGADTPRFDNPDKPTGHLNRLLQTPALILGPLSNLEAVGSGEGWLIAAPLNIASVCASPTRAVWVKGVS